MTILEWITNLTGFLNRLSAFFSSFPTTDTQESFICGLGVFCEPWTSPAATIVAALIALLAAFLTVRKMKQQMAATSQQVLDAERREQLSDILQLALKKEEMLLEWANVPVPIELDLAKQILNDKIQNGKFLSGNLTLVVNDAQKLIEVHNSDQPGKEPKKLRWVSPIKQASVIIALLPDGEAKRQFMDKNHEFYGLRDSLDSFSATYAHFVFMVQEMVNLGYDTNAARVLLGSSYHPAEFVYKLGALDEAIFDRSRFLSALGGFDHGTIKVYPNAVFLKELQSLKLVSTEICETDLKVEILKENSTREHIFVVQNLKDQQKSFMRNNGKWSPYSK